VCSGARAGMEKFDQSDGDQGDRQSPDSLHFHTLLLVVSPRDATGAGPVPHRSCELDSNPRCADSSDPNITRVEARAGIIAPTRVGNARSCARRFPIFTEGDVPSYKGVMGDARFAKEQPTARPT
jgi:hypothetical protein